MAAIRWLHLSDFHVGKDHYGQRKMFAAIHNHVKDRVECGAGPTFVFITGDIANSGKPEEYEEFYEEFFSPLYDILDKSAQQNIYCVPGNHDVDRNLSPLIRRETIIQEFPHFLDATAKSNILRKPIVDRFQAFCNYDLTSDPPHWLTSDSGSFVVTKDIGGVNFAIVGLNTAWHAQDNKDESQLAAGANILEDALARTSSAAVKIVLGHHPLSWLRDADASPIRAILARHQAIYLHGHLHKNQSKLEEGAGRLFRTFQAGAAFQTRDDERWTNRLLWCELKTDQQTIIAEAFTWYAPDREWRLDGHAFPEVYRIPNEARWVFPLGVPEATVSNSISLPSGWELISANTVLDRRRTITDEELIRFFDGSVPDWGLAVSPRLPRRQIVANILDSVKAGLISSKVTVILLSGAGGEGKTTSLLQAAEALLAEGVVNAVVWRSSGSEGLTKGVPYPHLDRLAVVADDADTLLPGLEDQIRLVRGNRHVVFLLAARDTDWFAAGGKRTRWEDVCRFTEINLRGLNEVDATMIVTAWFGLGSRGAGALAGTDQATAAARLLEQARNEASDSEGALLGALLRTRHGPALRDHVRTLIAGLGAVRGRAAKSRTLEAFAYICAVHAESLDILTEEILAFALQVDTKDLRRGALMRLGQEAAATTHSGLVSSRHGEIARAALDVFTKEYGHHHGTLLEELLLAADAAANEGTPIRKLHDWRFKLVDHFLKKGDFAVAQQLAGALVRQNVDNPFFATKFSSVLRECGEEYQAYEMLIRAVSRVRLARDATRSFYNEFAAAARARNEESVSIWLAGIALSDITEAPLNMGNAEISLGILRFNLTEHGDGFPQTAEGVGDLVRTRWRSRERDLPEIVPRGDSLSFQTLNLMLNKLSRTRR